MALSHTSVDIINSEAGYCFSIVRPCPECDRHMPEHAYGRTFRTELKTTDQKLMQLDTNKPRSNETGAIWLDLLPWKLFWYFDAQVKVIAYNSKTIGQISTQVYIVV